ncbi:hypothetical protein TNCT_503621 [Trichonephila clavata]|uniref:Uncharacterized protein n=1 Tax=Trichonephila clavata TaxID=2740835 RepID=A0A8X6LMF3_TRICU|nr:hypothetical protein TNCT_503621 [Trichonephila clavata]
MREAPCLDTFPKTKQTPLEWGGSYNFSSVKHESHRLLVGAEFLNCASSGKIRSEILTLFSKILYLVMASGKLWEQYSAPHLTVRKTSQIGGGLHLSHHHSIKCSNM